MAAELGRLFPAAQQIHARRDIRIAITRHIYGERNMSRFIAAAGLLAMPALMLAAAAPAEAGSSA